jgi:glycosyltransferase involved in cell wall biosynthesis
MPSVSITIPAYNEEEDILLTLADLNHQTNKDFEVLVVNNKSTDRTPEIVRDFSSKANYPLKLLNEPNPGVGNARKNGADDAISRNIPILAGTDADCDIDPAWVEGIVSSLNQEADAVTGKLIWSLKRLATVIEPLEDEVKKRLTRLFEINNSIVEHTLRTPLLTGSNFGVKIDVYEKTGGFIQPQFEGRPAPQEDWDLGKKINKLGYKTAFAKTDNPTNPRRMLDWLIAEHEPELIYDSVLTHIRPKDFIERLNRVSDERIDFRIGRVILFHVLIPIIKRRVTKPEKAEWFLGERTNEFIDDFNKSGVASIEDKDERQRIMDVFSDKYLAYMASRVKSI